MPLRRRLGRIGSACAGEPHGDAQHTRWRECIMETTGGRRPEACERAGVAARVGEGEIRQIVGWEERGRSAAVHVAGGHGKV
eukprot:394811-Pleurochrysis_carterae.AAC.1